MKEDKRNYILAILLLGFIIYWTYNIFFNNLFPIIEVEEESYKGIINIWDYPRVNVETGSKYSWIEEKIENFEKRHPGVYIKLTPIDGKGIDNIEKAFNQGNRPDIIPVGNSFNYLNMLEPLDEYFEVEELNSINTKAINGVKYEGKMVAYPVGLTTYSMYLNLDLFNKKGVSPPSNGNWSYEEFIKILKKLTYDEEEDRLVSYFGFNSFITPGYYNLWGIILSEGAEIFDEKTNEYAFYGEEAIRGLEKLINLKEKYNVTPDYFGLMDEQECWEMFYKDKTVAVYPTGSWAVKVLDALEDKGEGFNFDVANYPVGSINRPIVVSDGILSYGIIEQEDEKKKEMCVKFLKSLTDDNNQKSLEDIGLFSVKKDIDNMYINNPKMKKIEESISYTYYLPLMDNWAEIDKIIQEEIKMAVIGEKSLNEAVESGKNRIEKLTK